MRHIPSTLLTLLALSLPFSALAVEIADVPQDHWARDAVAEATGPRRLMSGMKDGTFQGDQQLSRLQFAYVLKTMIKEFETALNADIGSDVKRTGHFTDLEGYPADVVALVEEEASRYGAFDGLTGVASGRFDPGRTVTRFEYARVISNLMQAAETKGLIQGSASDGSPIPFRDTAGYPESVIEKAWRRYGVMAGFPDNSFRPAESMTRYQFAAAAVKALPALQERIVKQPEPTPTPMPQPTPMIIPIPVPEPQPTPEPTPTPTVYQHHNYEVSTVYSMLPNGTAGLGSTNGLFGIRFNAGQDVGDFVVQERAILLPTAPVTTNGTQGALGLGFGYRWKVTDNFHIVPSVGADLWGEWDLGLNALLATAGGGLGLEWWIVPQFSVSLAGEVRQGFTKWSVSPTANPGLYMMYGGDFKLRYYPISRFAIQLGASAWGVPEVGGNGGMNMLAGPNAGLSWQF